MTPIRKGQAPGAMSRQAFQTHFQSSFFDPAFDAEREAIARLEEIAWDGYSKSRKAPAPKKPVPDLPIPLTISPSNGAARAMRWIAAEKRQKTNATPPRVLLIIGAARNDGTCPGEISKSFRLANAAEDIFRSSGMDVDRLDLSLLSSEYGRTIHPCKSCVSTAMPLCHWPCSCEPRRQ